MTTSLQALLFDVDGTLADTERDGHRLAFNRAFAEAGLDWEWDVPLYGELLAVTGGKERMHFYIDRYRSDYRKPADFDALVAKLHKNKTRHYTELLATGAIPLRPGVLRLLREARAAGLRLAIATTTTPENVYALLESAISKDAPRWFEVIAAGDIVPAKKPAPDIYQYTLQKMQLKADACIAFEDSENGLRSARGAGLTTVVTINDYTRTHCFDDAALVLDHMGEPTQPCRTLAAQCAHDIQIGKMLDLDSVRRLHAACVKTPRA